MRVTYDPEADVIYLHLTEPAPGEPAVARTQEIAPGLIVDFDERGCVVGIEVLAASRRPSLHPTRLAFEVLSAPPPDPAEVA